MNKGHKADPEADLKEKAEHKKGHAKSEKETAGEAKEPEIKATENVEVEEELQVRYLRLAADFQNFKRRTEKEKSDIYAFANEKLMTELLDVTDNLERALSTAAPDNTLAEGIDMVLKQLKGVLEKNGLEEIKADGEAFDPNFHHAVMVEAEENRESGEITTVLQKGYLLNKKVIRPAMVKVAE
ncbi:MAG: nucleotide exchange factor GrpE [Eubacteriales bacterium]|nr:nucleotide exchange factor GrpE [Eubacteriales bacterium]MDD3349273.1 nucleotide exchange factor GrpE [Eubacteriales bacterium]